MKTNAVKATMKGETWSDEVTTVIQSFFDSMMESEGEEEESEVDEEEVDQEDVPTEDELEEEEEVEDMPTLDEALANFIEGWQSLAEDMADSEESLNEEEKEGVVEEDALSV